MATKFYLHGISGSSTPSPVRSKPRDGNLLPAQAPVPCMKPDWSGVGGGNGGGVAGASVGGAGVLGRGVC